MNRYIEECKKVRSLTLAPMNKIAVALQETEGDINKAVELLVKQKAVDANDMANRVANANVVYSYVHNNRVGSMIVLACQTDFAAKNEHFLNLAKDICMHIVSTSISPLFISRNDIDPRNWQGIVNIYRSSPACAGKPPQVVEKIVEGKMNKYYSEVCLLDQPFVKDDKITIQQLIQNVSSTLGEKIELKKFVKMTTSEVPHCREDGCH